MTLDTAFLGVGWSFPPAFDARGKGALTVDRVEDIEQSLRILLSTTPGERVMQPGYGCDLRRMVFEPVHEGTLTEIRSLVDKAVLFFEARIELEQVSFDTAGLQDGVLAIRLDYTVRTTHTRHNLVYPLYLHQGMGGSS